MSRPRKGQSRQGQPQQGRPRHGQARHGQAQQGQPRHGWIAKFAVAFSGISGAVRTNPSFWVHLPVALAVLVACAGLDIEAWRWCVVTLAIGSVLSCELLNSSIEELVRVLHPQHDARIGHALDVAAGAVLVAAVGAAAAGLIALFDPVAQAWLENGFLVR